MNQKLIGYRHSSKYLLLSLFIYLLFWKWQNMCIFNGAYPALVANRNNIVWQCSYCCYIFDQVTAALVSIRDFKKSYPKLWAVLYISCKCLCFESANESVYSLVSLYIIYVCICTCFRTVCGHELDGPHTMQLRGLQYGSEVSVNMRGLCENTVLLMCG